ncbi:MAG: glycosyl transferase [Gammaproteobacteria bacterium]|nr:glycosyl transferase [Gammaproteobacteria bacterium]
MKIALIIPTYNAEKFVDDLFSGIAKQTLQPDEILVIDSSSQDKTLEKLQKYSCKIHSIPQAEFNHGGTRQLATELIDADIYIYMTQDAIAADENSFKNLVAAFDHPKVGCAYGRQLPHKNSSYFGAHARLFLYPEQSSLKSYESRQQFGIRTCFNSDSFSAYRKEVLVDAGGFPSKLIVSEDAYVAAKMLLQGWLVAYEANARVYHSHNYSLSQEFRRYFDIGVFHKSQHWIIEAFHNPTLTGMQFMRSELNYLRAKKAYHLLPLSILRSAMKYLAYRLGHHYEKLPRFLTKRLSAQKAFWQGPELKKSLRLLVYSLNYAPELTGIGKYNAEMCEWLASRGHRVTVLTAQPYYPGWKVFKGYSAWKYSQENINGVTVLRCPIWVPTRPSSLKRLAHLLSFACSSLPRLLFSGFKPNVLFFVEPSVFCFPNALLAAKLYKAKPILHVQDFEVDVAFNLGMMKCHFLHKMLLNFEKAVFKRCSFVSTITVNMKAKLLEKGLDEDKALLFPNWSDTENIRPLPTISPLREQLNISNDKIVVLYSGNMGAKQGLEIIIEAANALKENPKLLFVMGGEGSFLEELKKLAQAYHLHNVIWLPLQPIEKLNELLNMADIHILPQKPDVKDQVMPSKLLGMLASGRPILATAVPNTQLYEVVLNTGMASPPGDIAQLVGNLESLAQDQALRVKLGQQARAYAEQHLSKQAILTKFEADLQKLLL